MLCICVYPVHCHITHINISIIHIFKTKKNYRHEAEIESFIDSGRQPLKNAFNDADLLTILMTSEKYLSRFATKLRIIIVQNAIVEWKEKLKFSGNNFLRNLLTILFLLSAVERW
jgi:hypothetical protein